LHKKRTPTVICKEQGFRDRFNEHSVVFADFYNQVGESFMSNLSPTLLPKNLLGERSTEREHKLEQKNMIIAVVVIAIIAVAGIGMYEYSALSSAVKNPTTFIYDTIGEPQYLDPAVCYETGGGEIIQNCYETLLFYVNTSSSEMQGILAYDNWTTSSDGLTYTFWLRPDITFTDGTPFNASVMKWSIDRFILMNDPEGGSWMSAYTIRGGYDYFGTTLSLYGSTNATEQQEIYQAAKAYLEAGGVEIVNNYEIKIHIDYQATGTAYPAFKFITAFSGMSAVSPSYVEANGGSDADAAAATDLGTVSLATWLNANYGNASSLSTGLGVIPCARNIWMLDHICGTGPFKLSATGWEHGVRVTMDRNDAYWGGPWGHGANLERVIVNYVPTFETRKLHLLAGDADTVDWGAIYADQIMDTTTRKVLAQYASTIQIFVDMPTLVDAAGQINCNATLEAVTATTNHNAALGVHENPFQYKAFRQAVQYSFDHTAFMTALNGFGVIKDGAVNIGMTGYSPDVPLYTYDAAKALALFNSVGWKGTINIYYNEGNTARERACLLLKDGIETITGGAIKITVNSLNWPTFLAMRTAKKLPMFFVGWLSDYPDADNNVFTYDHSQGTYAYRIPYANATIDAMITQAATETNATLRTQLYLEISTELHWQAIYLWLDQGTAMYVFRSWVHGFVYNQLMSGYLYYWFSKS
jgi:peptide/nickel transport system substrate-binding protein